MNVLIPRGTIIGNNSILSAGTIIRTEIPEKCLVYHKQDLVMKDGIHHNGLIDEEFK